MVSKHDKMHCHVLYLLSPSLPPPSLPSQQIPERSKPYCRRVKKPYKPRGENFWTRCTLSHIFTFSFSIEKHLKGQFYSALVQIFLDTNIPLSYFCSWASVSHTCGMVRNHRSFRPWLLMQHIASKFQIRQQYRRRKRKLWQHYK